MRIGERVLYNDKEYFVLKLLAGRVIIRPVHSTVSGDWMTVARCEVKSLELKFNDIREVK